MVTLEREVMNISKRVGWKIELGNTWGVSKLDCFSSLRCIYRSGRKSNTPRWGKRSREYPKRMSLMSPVNHLSLLGQLILFRALKNIVFAPLLLLILIEPFSCLAPKPTGSNHLSHEGGWSIFRVFKFVIYSLSFGQNSIQTNKVR